MLDKILMDKVDKPSQVTTNFSFRFPECHRLPSPVLPFDRYARRGSAPDNHPRMFGMVIVVGCCCEN